MGIRAWYDVWCDAEDCLFWAHGDSSRRRAASAARQQGYRRTKDGWRCPEHRGDVCGLWTSGFEGDRFCGDKPGHSGDHWRIYAS